MIAPSQIETALGYPVHHTFPSDYPTVSSALNSGVPLALTNHSEIAAQFDRFSAADHRPWKPGRSRRGRQAQVGASLSFFSWYGHLLRDVSAQPQR